MLCAFTKVLLDMGLRGGLGTFSACVLEDDVATALVASLFSFWRHAVAGEIQLTLLNSAQMPGLAFTQLHADEDVRRCGMQVMKTLYAKLESAEKYARGVPAANQQITDLGWPASQWCRELMVGALEQNWECLPVDLRSI